MRFLDATTYTADKAWDALDIAEIDHATVRLHWTDKPRTNLLRRARR